MLWTLIERMAQGTLPSSTAATVKRDVLTRSRAQVERDTPDPLPDAVERLQQALTDATATGLKARLDARSPRER